MVKSFLLRADLVTENRMRWCILTRFLCRPPASPRGMFPSIHCGNLAELLRVKFTTGGSVLEWVAWSLPQFVSCGSGCLTCHPRPPCQCLWASARQVAIPCVRASVFSNLGQRFALWPYFSYRYKESCCFLHFVQLFTCC